MKSKAPELNIPPQALGLFDLLTCSVRHTVFQHWCLSYGCTVPLLHLVRYISIEHVLWITVRWEAVVNVSYRAASCTAVCVGKLFGNRCRSETPSKLGWGSVSTAQPYEDSQGYIWICKASYGKQLQQCRHNGFSNKDQTFNDAETTWLWGSKNCVYYIIWHTRKSVS